MAPSRDLCVDCKRVHQGRQGRCRDCKKVFRRRPDHAAREREEFAARLAKGRKLLGPVLPWYLQGGPWPK